MNELKLALSAIFGFIGSVALYVSTLICGHNIFKELPFHLSAMIAGFIGFWLFMFSPVSFVIMFPELFDIAPQAVPTKLQVETIYRLLKEAISPFLLAAVGLGIVIGAISEIKPRRTILRSVNGRFGLYLREFSYDFAWDAFLRGVKKLGLIKLVLKDQTITGHLQNYSVASEPKQLIMKNCLVETTPTGTPGGCTMKMDNMLITELSEIREIAVDNHSLKKHYHELNHCSQTTYLLAAAFGSIILAGSSELTCRFLDHHRLSMVSGMYAGIGFFFSAASLVLMVIGFTNLKHDFRTFSATAAFYPSLAFLPTLMLPASCWLIVRSGCNFFGYTYHNMLLLAATGVVFSCATAWWLRALLMYRHILRSIQAFMCRNSMDYDRIKEIVGQLYIACDFNQTTPLDYASLQQSVVQNVCRWSDISREEARRLTGLIFETVKELKCTVDYLCCEESNVLVLWHEALKRERLHR
ncbi:hypothetical protein [Geomonas anaerohicana]|uniref:Uncharacterized protein n=1 Tax=Geomonas anaerohicana TaxID=2798583 RepID=A0ABS0YHQ0_9BACT|nr:hypothetical protein [Geomonas anaerohicana]MBJ6751839.1 hypothetical protein [Geomonas anaerohicana]